MKIAAFGCLILAVSSAAAEAQPIFTPRPPVTSISTRTQAPATGSVDLNQAAMSQIISQLNQRQFQLSVAAAQSAPQRTIFVPQKIRIKPAK
jgi:hypothetical protein